MNTSESRKYPLLIGALVLVALLVTATSFVVSSRATKTVTVYFTNVAGLYEGDPVTVRGVEVGTVDGIIPEGDRVAVQVTYDADVTLPADVRAAIVSPTLVTGRFIQFSPQYSGGDVLENGSEIGTDRTVVPVEFDQIKEQFSALATALGPEGANSAGAVSRFAESGAQALEGRGTDLNATVRALADAGTTVDQSSDDLFASIEGLAAVVEALADADRDVAGFARDLSGVSGALADSREDLKALLEILAPTMAEVSRFVAENEQALAGELGDLTDTTGQLVDRMDEIAALLHVGPTAVSNLYNIYDRGANSVTGALMVPDPVNPLDFLCGLALTVGAPLTECDALDNALSGFGSPTRELSDIAAPGGPR